MIDCEALKAILIDKKGREACFVGKEKPCSIISAMKASKLLRQGYEGYWCYAMDIKENEEIAKKVVCEFERVFLGELPGLPPQGEIDFEIKLSSRSQPSLKALIVWPQQTLKS